MEYILDSIWNADGIQTIGAMAITGLQYPTVVEPNTSFNIKYNANNTSATNQNAFGYIFDFGTQAQIPGSYWEAAVTTGQSYPVTVNFPNGITTVFSGEIRVGHIDGGIQNCASPTGTEGVYICGDASYPNAPVPGRRYQCVNGQWVDLGVDSTNCPISPPQPPGFNPLFIVAAVCAVGILGIVFLVVKK